MQDKEDLLEEADERFCIMTTMGNIGDVEALKHISGQYGKEFALELWLKYCKKGEAKE